MKECDGYEPKWRADRPRPQRRSRITRLALIPYEYASPFKECVNALRVRCIRLTREHEAARREQCADTGHLALVLFIIDHPRKTR